MRNGEDFYLDLDALGRRLGRPPVTRFAPSPTGHLHVGHLVNALYTWGIARHLGGRVIVRMEDHDRQRSRREFERSILEDLDWLGLEGDGPVLRQSSRPMPYRETLKRLQETQHVYGCDASRRELNALVQTPPGVEPRYPNLSRDKGLGIAGEVNVRLQLPDDAISFYDFGYGMQTQIPQNQCGDLQLRDRNHNWTYQYAVSVDDWYQDVTLVIRGKDILSSTGRQILLSRMIGRPEPPLYLHHPLILDETRKKLSKRDKATSLQEWRAAGMTAEESRGRALADVGLLPEPKPLSNEQAFQLIIREGG